jgi:hypothetical protein
MEASEEDAAFDLSAGDRERVVDGLERPAVDLDGRELAVAGGDAGSHGGQRRHDAAHGAAGEAFVPGQAADEGLAGEQAGEHADGGTGVAGIQVG